MTADPRTELLDVLAHYDLGQLVDFQPDLRGTVNTSFVVDLVKEGVQRKYFLRRYKPEILEREILFEHSLIRHLTARGTCPAARVHPTRDGSTYLRVSGAPSGAFYALFDYLPGEDRYTWVDPHCTPGELRAAGRLLAQFHNDASSLVPEGHREEPRTLELLGRIDRLWSDSRAASKGTAFDAYLVRHSGLIHQEIAGTLSALREPAAGGMPDAILHSDYHPGNLRFQGRAISGLVDFDWAKRDWRAFDVALALWYFCVSWRTRADGILRLAATREFLIAYQARLLEGAEIPPLHPAELHYLPHLLDAANIYVLYWTLRDYFGKPVDPAEYLGYLRHHVAFARWFGRAGNRRRLEALLASLPNARGEG